MKKFFIIGVATLMIAACSADKAENNSDVAERQALMKDWRAANDILKGMMENPDNFDATLAKEQTQYLVDTSQKMWTYFKDENAKGKAQAAVWTDAEGFLAATEHFNVAAVNVNDAAQHATQASDIKEVYGKLAESCGGCHKLFKQ